MSYTLSNNTPSAGCIQWTGLKMQYKGTVYTISDGYSNYPYAYWLASNPTALVVSDTYPTLTADDCLVFLNKNGIGVVVPGATTLDGSLIVPGTVLADAIAANAITGDKIAAGTIEASNIAAGTISSDLIAANAIGAANIAAGAVTADKLVAGAVTTDKLAANAVTTNKLAANAVSATNIAANAVTAAKIAAEAITANKLAANAVTAGSIAAGAITADKIQSGAVTAVKIADIDGTLNIVSGGDLNIQGGDLHVNGGDSPGEYLGISSDGETTIFTGADDATGAGAKFSLSKQGEARMRDARVEGEVEVNGSLTLGEGVEVSFRDDAARMNFLRAMAAGNALPYNMGGTGADSRTGAMGNLGMIVGMDEPGDVTAQNIGDRYLLIKPGSTTAGNTATLARSGYSYQKISRQRRLKTVNVYTFLSGNPQNLPSNSTTYSSWSDTSTEYGALSATDAAYCHEASGTVSGSYSGSSSSTTGSSTTSGCVWRRTTTTNYEYRTYTRLVYRAVLPAPTAGTTDADIKSLSVKTALLTLATDATESGKYSFYLADSVDGQTGKTLIGTVTGTGSLSFSLLDHIADLYNGVKYLVIERAGSSSAITVTAATLTLTYFSGARRTEEYAWNGTEWRPLAIGTEYFFDEANDAVIAVNDYLFTVPITDGHESSQYEFEFLGKANANSTTNFILCLNGDNVYANYRSRVIYGSNVYSERARIGNTGSIATPTFARGTITVIGGYVVVTGQGMWASYNTAYSVVYGDGETELTAINIRVEGSAAGVGCRMKVKRK